MRIADEILTGQQTDNTATFGVGYPESYPGPVAPLGQTEASQATTYHTTLGARVSSEALGPTAMDGITIGNITGNLDEAASSPPYATDHNDDHTREDSVADLIMNLVFGTIDEPTDADLRVFTEHSEVAAELIQSGLQDG